MWAFLLIAFAIDHWGFLNYPFYPTQLSSFFTKKHGSEKMGGLRARAGWLGGVGEHLPLPTETTLEGRVR